MTTYDKRIDMAIYVIPFLFITSIYGYKFPGEWNNACCRWRQSILESMNVEGW